MKAEIKERIKMIKNNEVPERYESYKSGIYPKEWPMKTLSDVGNISTGITPLRSRSEYFQGTIPWVKTTDLNNSYIYDTEEKISEKALNETSIKLVNENSILIAMYGGFNQIGRTGLMKIKGSTNQAISSIYVDEINYNSEYILHWLNSNKKYWKRMAGSSRKDPNITKKDVEDFPIAKPGYDEQQKIAAILSSWDKSIKLKERFLEQKKEQKRGVMKKLVAGEVRLPGFEGDWKEVELAKVAKQSTLKNTKNMEIRVLSCTKYDGLVDSLQYFGRRMFSDDISKYKIVKQGEICYATNHIEEGSIGIMDKYDIGLVSPMYTVFKVADDNDSNYVFQVLKSERYVELYKSLMSASVNRRGSLRWKEFSKIKIPCPQYDEQVAISNFINLVNHNIALLEKELEAFKLQKKGLMQLLLTGIVRTTV